ncbi:hypothetical protein QEN19_001860 [Hanseniaspora menglaensis]
MLLRCFKSRRIITSKLGCKSRNFSIVSSIRNESNKAHNDELSGLFKNYMHELKEQNKQIKDTESDGFFKINDEIDAFDDLDETYNEEHYFMSKEEESYMLQKVFDKNNMKNVDNVEGFQLKKLDISERNSKSGEELKKDMFEKETEKLDTIKSDNIVVDGVGDIFAFLKENGENEKMKKEKEITRKQRLSEVGKQIGNKSSFLKKNELFSLDDLETIQPKQSTKNNTENSIKRKNIEKVNVASLLKKELSNESPRNLTTKELILSLNPNNYYFNDLFKNNSELYEPIFSNLIKAKLQKYSKKELIKVFENENLLKKSLKKDDYINSIISDIWKTKTDSTITKDRKSLILTKFQIRSEYLKLAQNDKFISDKIFRNMKKSRYAVAIKEVLGNPNFSDVIVIHSKELEEQLELNKFKNFGDFVFTTSVETKKLMISVVNTIKSANIMKEVKLNYAGNDDKIFLDFIAYLEQRNDCILDKTGSEKLVLKMEGTSSFDQTITDYIKHLIETMKVKKQNIEKTDILIVQVDNEILSEELMCKDGFMTMRPLLTRNSKIDTQPSKFGKAVLDTLQSESTFQTDTNYENFPYSLIYDKEQVTTQHSLIPGYLLQKNNEIKFESDTAYLASKLSNLIVKEPDSFKKVHGLNCNFIPFIDKEVLLSDSKAEKIDINQLSLPNIEFIFDLKPFNDWSQDLFDIDGDSLMIVANLSNESKYLQVPFKEYDFNYVKEKYLMLDKNEVLQNDEEVNLFESWKLKINFDQETVMLQTITNQDTFKIKMPILLADGETKDTITVKYKMTSQQLLTNNYFSNTYDNISIFQDVKILSSDGDSANKRNIAIDLESNDNIKNIVVLDRFNNSM